MSVITELFDLYARNGNELRPADVVEFARDPQTALHKRFTWDDTEAAHKWRLHEASELIRVSVYLEPSKQTPIRASVRTSDPTSASEYRHLNDVLDDSERRGRLIRDALKEVKNWRARYEAVTELAPIFAAIDEIAQEVAHEAAIVA